MSELDRLLQGKAVDNDDDDDDSYDDDDDDETEDDDEEEDLMLVGGGSALSPASRVRRLERFEARAAERLSVRLLAVPDDDSDEEDRIVRESLQLGPSFGNILDVAAAPEPTPSYSTSTSLSPRPDLATGRILPRRPSAAGTIGFPSPFAPTTATTRFSSMRPSQSMMTLRTSTSLGSLSTRGRSLSSGKLDALLFLEQQVQPQVKAERGIWFMAAVALGVLAVVVAASAIGVAFVGPPSQPVGPYTLVERQEGDDFFQYYTFYEGRDSVGSNGYNTYVGMQAAKDLNIVNVSYEVDELDVFGRQRHRRRWNRRQLQEQLGDVTDTKGKEPFVYMSSSPTVDGPRNSIRLEGIRRFNRGLFIIDLRHMPAGCGMWPAFWLTDEANWPVNGEIDIVEGVNYQSEAKTALHSTDGCSMADIPLGTMTGTWDTAQGIPDAKTGIPDMTLRYAQNCFVYDPHQWLNQGCVAVDTDGNTLGQPLNANGGGVFALEWDPINRHIRSWVFTPHKRVPPNLVDAIRTADLNEEDRIMPDPDLWPVPYGYYAIGEGTDCPSSHFRQMRLVLNLAFCGSVAGNRFQLDCPVQAKSFDTCNEYIKSQPDELNEAYWKIRGVYVYERQWERTWLT